MELMHLTPILWTMNLEETKAFYVDLLGFSSKSNFPRFISVIRNNAELMFIVPEIEPEECKDPNDKRNHMTEPMLTGSIYIFVDEVDELWERLKDKVRIKTNIADRQYLMRDFSIYDNNNYEIVFGKDISQKK